MRLTLLTLLSMTLGAGVALAAPVTPTVAPPHDLLAATPAPAPMVAVFAKPPHVKVVVTPPTRPHVKVVKKPKRHHRAKVAKKQKHKRVKRVNAPRKPKIHRGKRPSRTHFWIGGHHDWHGGTYVWVSGRWEAPRQHKRWRRGHYRHETHGDHEVQIWVSGDWH